MLYFPRLIFIYSDGLSSLRSTKKLFNSLRLTPTAASSPGPARTDRAKRRIAVQFYASVSIWKPEIGLWQSGRAIPMDFDPRGWSEVTVQRNRIGQYRLPKCSNIIWEAKDSDATSTETCLLFLPSTTIKTRGVDWGLIGQTSFNVGSILKIALQPFKRE